MLYLSILENIIRIVQTKIQKIDGNSVKFYQVEYESHPKMRWIEERMLIHLPHLINQFLKQQGRDKSSCVGKSEQCFNKKKTAGYLN